MKHFGYRALIAATVIILAACGPKHGPGKTDSVKRPDWSNEQAAAAINKMADQYRKDPAAFMNARTYVWSGTWLWPETIGIGSKHFELMKKMFYEGDEAVREIVLNVILMNLPPGEIESRDKDFIKDLVLMDTDIKERRANVPPPSDSYEIIEEYVDPE